MLPNTTPVPNALFDVYLKELKSAELKVLLVIIRQTLGWSDRRAVRGRKEKDWISNGQLRNKTGSSRRAISSATETLVHKQLIEISDGFGNSLTDPLQRKGKLRLYYRASPLLLPIGDNMGKSCWYPFITDSTSAIIAQDLSKNVTALAQKMHTTKETHYKTNSYKNY